MKLLGEILKAPFSLTAAIFYSLLLNGLYEGPGQGSDITADLLYLINGSFFSATLGLWVLADARKRRLRLPYSTGSFVYFAFYIAVPAYLFYTRGWRAFITLGCFLLICIAAALASWLPSLMMAMEPQEPIDPS